MIESLTEPVPATKYPVEEVNNLTELKAVLEKLHVTPKRGQCIGSNEVVHDINNLRPTFGNEKMVGGVRSSGSKL